MPLANVDPESVRAHAVAYTARSGSAQSFAAVAAALGDAGAVPMGEPVADAAGAPVGAPPPTSQPNSPAERDPAAIIDDDQPLEHVTVAPLPIPSMAAVVCFIGVML
eukprot:1769071-Prymnesium_polylepis.1